MIEIKTLPRMPARSGDANKGACGKILVIGGARGMAGAVCLTVRAAYRSGAGLVKACIPQCIWDIIAIKLDEALTEGVDDTPFGTIKGTALLDTVQDPWHDVAVIGPGLGATKDKTTCKGTFDFILRHSRPTVLDADGLNALAVFGTDQLGNARQKQAPPMILTPHPGEMARLLNCSISEVQSDRLRAAERCAMLTKAIVVLKGAGTVVTDGVRYFVNRTGNPGMATGGTGDVLAGVIGALLGQQMKAMEAAILGVYLHGLAGDLVARELGIHSLMAGDLIDKLPEAIRKSV